MLPWRNEDAGDLKSPSERSPGSSPGGSTNLFYVMPFNIIKENFMSDKNTKQKTTDKLIVNVGTLFYAPTISNKPVVCTLIDESEESPIYIEESHLWYKEDGCSDDSVNPILFPYTQKSYNRLVHVYPNIEKYDETVLFDYNNLCLQLLEIVDGIAVKHSDKSFQDAIDYSVVNFKSRIRSFKFNVPVNPYTYEPCKTVNEYFEIKKSILEKIDN